MSSVQKILAGESVRKQLCFILMSHKLIFLKCIIKTMFGMWSNKLCYWTDKFGHSVIKMITEQSIFSIASIFMP
jgi:hypothetical protein